MANPEAIWQLARLVGRDALERGLGLPAGSFPNSLTTDQMERLGVLLDERTEALAAGLLAEAQDSDDVHDAASADTYLEDRLEFFGGLLTERQRQDIRRLYRARTATWV